MNFATSLSPRLTPQPPRLNRHEFPSKKVVPVDWHKLASVDLHDLYGDQCSADTLQEHLNHIAFCQAEKEIHVQNAAGQRNLLKMFRLAQLIIQYLFISQDYIESQLNQSKKEHQAMLEKYNEMKEKLKIQIEEAKKLKKSNQNMCDGNVYLSSLLSSMGAIVHFRCPFCPKAFRSKEFLLSHLRRKHPLQAESVDVGKCFVSTVDSKTGDPTAQFHPFTNPDPMKKPSNSQMHRQTYTLEQPTTSKTGSYSAFFKEENKGDLAEGSVLTPYDGETHTMQGSDLRKGKNNDIDLYKLQKMQENFASMNDTILQLSRDLETQKKLVEIKNQMRDKEVKNNLEEKLKLKEDYEYQIRKLNEKIEMFEAKATENLVRDQRNVIDLINKQQSEINTLKQKFRSQDILNANENESIFFQKELDKLRQELKSAKIRHEKELKRVKKSLKSKYKSRLEQIKQEHQMQIVPPKRINSHPITPFQDATPRPIPRGLESIPRPIPRKGKSIPKPIPREVDSIPRQIPQRSTKPTARRRATESDSEETESADDDDDSRRRRTLQTATDEGERESSQPESPEPEGGGPQQGAKRTTMYSNEDDSESEHTLAENPAPTRISLKELTERNPGLWNQMRDVIEEELARKLTHLGVDQGTKGVTNKDFKFYLSQIIKTRQTLREKYEDFDLIRKSLENEVENKFLMETPPKRRGEGERELRAKGLKGSLRKLTSKFKLETKPLQRIIKAPFKRPNKSAKESKDKQETTEDEEDEGKLWKDEEGRSEEGLDDISDEDTKPSSQQSENAVDPRAGRTLVRTQTVKSVQDALAMEEDSDSSAHQKLSKEMRVEIHATESRQHLSPKNVPFRPRRQSFFENKTYGKISEEDWDSPSDPSASAHKYENVSAVRVAAAASVEPNTMMQEVNQEIKLKRPSGENVTKLSRKIESQLIARSQQKPVGAIDVMGRDDKSKEVEYDIDSILSNSD